MSLTIKEVFDGAAGARSVIYIVIFVSGIFSIYFGMQGAIKTAAIQAATADMRSTENRDDNASIASRVQLLEYQTKEALKVQSEQTLAIKSLTKLTIQIATKLNVDQSN